ncbi:replication endonuclease, partial [Xenorhabdus bovienii]|nr:replication endonuclease [Xenorhabdus bovienii]
KYIPFGSPYGEDIHSIQGVTSPLLSRDEFICTRLHQWSIVPKSDASVPECGVHKNNAIFSSWSSVNNCTDDQINHSRDERSGITKSSMVSLVNISIKVISDSY